MHNAVDPYRHTLWVYVRESLCLCVRTCVYVCVFKQWMYGLSYVCMCVCVLSTHTVQRGNGNCVLVNNPDVNSHVLK